MNAPPIRIFLTGTRRDLPDFFVAATVAINQLDGYRAFGMEESVAEGIPPDKWSRREATKPDLIVGLLGRYYGKVPLGATQSHTEQEHDTAGVAGIERLMFLTDSGDPAVIKGQDDIARQRMEAFREKISPDVCYRTVQSPQEFAEGVVVAIREWERRTLFGATTTVERFYDPWLSDERLHGHQASLVGQRAVINALNSFTASEERVLLLAGSWGRGKSRILLEWAREGTDVRFIREGADVARRTLNISAVDPCVLVLDDAHRRSEETRESLFAFLRRSDNKVKLLMSTRPRPADEISTSLLRAGFDAREIRRCEVPILTNEEQQRLVAQILGFDGREAFGIAKRTRGNCLAAVVAARAFREERISIAEIESSDTFETHVLGWYREVLIGESGVPEPQAMVVLRAIALVAPFDPSDTPLLEVLAGFLGIDTTTVADTIVAFEDAGLLIRRGGLVRIPVDAVAETVLSKACRTPRGESTGYAERAIRTLPRQFRRPILRNLAMADLDAAAEDQPAAYLTAVWPELLDEYATSSPTFRLAFLDDLEDLAYLMPRDAVRFVYSALALGPAPDEPADKPEWAVAIEPAWIDGKLAKLLRGATQLPENLYDACSLLWRLAEPVSDLPVGESAESILRGQGEYHHGVLTSRYEIFVTWGSRTTPPAPNGFLERDSCDTCARSFPRSARPAGPMDGPCISVRNGFATTFSVPFVSAC